MDVKTAIQTRRAYRSLEPVAIGDEIIRDLAESANLAASCFNKQPWRFVFARGRETLDKLRVVFPAGNAWCHDASMVIAVFGGKELDCVMKDGREYWQFDTGMAVGQMILRATELGLVAHPIAGYDPDKVKEVLGIPADMTVITLVNVGKHTAEPKASLSEDQKKGELSRPPRQDFTAFAFIDRYTG
jgi:nitroreductase